MFNIPELDYMVCLKLSRHDLTQCLRVSKKWHQALIPYIWRDLSKVRDCSREKKKAFRRMVMDDYLLEKQLKQKRGDRHCTEQSTQKGSMPVLSLAQTYGPHVQVLPAPMDMLRVLQPPDSDSSSSKKRDKEPTAVELLRHLYEHCPAIQQPYVTFSQAADVSDEVLETIAQCLVPRTRSLRIGSRDRIESWRLKCLLSRCSSKLEQLTLRAEVACVDKGKDEKDWEPWSSFKELDLGRCRGRAGPNSFWAWLWKRCGYVEILKVRSVSEIAKSLGQGMTEHMPNLREIHLGSNVEESRGLKDADTAVLLSGSRKGWKVVKIGFSVKFDTSAKEALAKNFSTLEELVMAGQHVKGNDLVWALSSGFNLRSLIALQDGSFIADKYPSVGALEFIDQDPTSESLRPWASEKPLQVLKITITGIPRPDLKGQKVLKETRDGQGRDIQGQVYDRLARFTNLETLWLGYEAIGNRQRGGYRKDCLEMSLESGLQKLAGLKLLKELNVGRLTTRIRLKEVQWMAEHWPKLRTIRGFDGDDELIAKAWLQEHHPYISLK